MDWLTFDPNQIITRFSRQKWGTQHNVFPIFPKRARKRKNFLLPLFTASNYC